MSKIDEIRALVKDTEERLEKGVVPDWKIAVGHLYGINNTLNICMPRESASLREDIRESIIKIYTKAKTEGKV